MPPKKPATTTKTPAKTTTSKSTAAPKGGAAKGGAKAAPAGAKAPPQAKPAAEPPKAKREPLPEICLPVKSIAQLLLDDVDDTIKKSPGWPYVIDPSEVTARFVQFRDVNLLSALHSEEMHVERIRMALLGALRYGKPFIIDMHDADLFKLVSEKFEEILPGLTEMLLNKEILEEKNLEKLIGKTQSEEYSKAYEYRVSTFCFAILTTKEEVSEDMKSKMFVVRVG